MKIKRIGKTSNRYFSILTINDHNIIYSPELNCLFDKKEQLELLYYGLPNIFFDERYMRNLRRLYISRKNIKTYKAIVRKTKNIVNYTDNPIVLAAYNECFLNDLYILINPKENYKEVVFRIDDDKNKINNLKDSKLIKLSELAKKEGFIIKLANNVVYLYGYGKVCVITEFEKLLDGYVTGSDKNVLFYLYGEFSGDFGNSWRKINKDLNNEEIMNILKTPNIEITNLTLE